MVSADNLNFDCLELIFAYLYGNDLVSVALVSRSFLAAAIPKLYRKLFFRLSQAKRYPAIISPFASVLAHPNLSVHVRSIDIRTVPMVKSILHPVFMSDCARTISACENLHSFTCTPWSVLPAFLTALQGKSSLEHLRINASLTTDQSEYLIRVSGLRSLTIDSATWNLVDVLPRWMQSLKSTLTSLTLYSVQDLNEGVLVSIVSDLPKLTGLHVVGCSKIDQAAVLRVFHHTPLLESLSFTAWESSRSLPAFVSPLPHLRHLAIDTHTPLMTSTSNPAIWTQLMTLTRSWSCPLKSLVLKVSEKQAIEEGFFKTLVEAHEATLCQLAMINCVLSPASLRLVALRCQDIERLAIGVPTKEIYHFADSLSRAAKLHTLSDVGHAHPTHGQRAFLTKTDIRTLMESIPSLTRVVSDGRVWTGEKVTDWVDEGFSLTLQRKSASSPSHWFMPPESGLY